MEGELWKQVSRVVMELGNQFQRPHAGYPPALILLVYLWAVWNDRPVSWACRQENWPPSEQDWSKPSAATMSRRLRDPWTVGLMEAVQGAFEAHLPVGDYWYLDGKALLVGGATQDPDASWGRVAGGYAKGYKLHVLCSCTGGLIAWEVQSLSVSEQTVAYRLLQRQPLPGFVLADGNFDTQRMYQTVEDQGGQLLAHRRRPKAKALGHHRQHPARLRSLRMQRDGLKPLLAKRQNIERWFGNLVSFGGGLQSLPSWVRRLPRVRLWVGGKLIFNCCRILKNKRLTA